MNRGKSIGKTIQNHTYKVLTNFNKFSLVEPKRLLFIAMAMILGITENWHLGAIKASQGIRKIVIDAGHGGRDPGNLGTGRYKKHEKDIALDVALQIGNLLKQELPDVQIVYTRNSDKSVELHERTSLANREKADLFVSIHCDALVGSNALGSSSYVMGKDHSDENLRVAQRENSVIFLEDNYDQNYEGFDPSKPETYIALTLYQNHFQHQSIMLAQFIQNEIKNETGRKDRGVKQQPLWVTSRSAMPAVLVELGFLTTASEEDFLQSEVGKTKMAKGLAKAIVKFKKESDKLIISKPVKDSNEVASENINKEKVELSNSLENEVVYKIQIKSSANELKVTDPFFKWVKDELEMYGEKGNYKYTVGRYNSYAEAQKQANTLRKSGYKDAFVVAFKNNKRIDINEARKQSNP